MLSAVRGDVPMMRWGCAILGLLLAPGCVVVELGVTNPVPGLSQVAIVPFFNLSTEPSADGYRFAEAYFAELQKIPGFQVLPVGVTEAAIQDHQLDLQSPEDAVKLGQLLGVDAVVVGAITDYDPYYPPRVALQVSWYSAHPWEFAPGVPVEPWARKAILQAGFPPEDCEPAETRWQRTKRWFRRKTRKAHAEHSTIFRGQEPVFPPLAPPAVEEDLAPPRPLIPPEPAMVPPAPNPREDSLLQAPPPVPLEPLMAYTRLFDGADAGLTAALRDYLELRDDLRAGGWKSSLHRTEDFIRFASHRMIVEMLALHGGETRRRVVFVWRKEK